jgi:hypothetical protein
MKKALLATFCITVLGVLIILMFPIKENPVVEIKTVSAQQEIVYAYVTTSYDDEDSPLEDNNYTIDFENGKYEIFNFRKLKLIKRATLEEQKAAIKDGNLLISDVWDEWCKLVREKSKEYYQEDGNKK